MNIVNDYKRKNNRKKGKNLLTAENIIKEVSRNLNVTHKTCKDAIDRHKRYYRKNKLEKKETKIAAVNLYIQTGINEEARSKKQVQRKYQDTVKSICENKNIEAEPYTIKIRHFINSVRRIQKKQDIEGNPRMPKNYIQFYRQKLDMSEHELNKIKEICHTIQEVPRLAGHRPLPLAASTIHLVKGTSTEKLAKMSYSTKSTIKHNSKKILEEVEKKDVETDKLAKPLQQNKMEVRN